MTSSADETVIRYPEPGEAGRVRALWAHAFPEDSPAFTDWYFREMYDGSNTRGLFERGQPRAFLQMNPYTLRIRGRERAAAAVAGVSTWTEHRRRGLAARLLWDSLAVLRERGVSVAFLYPFSHDFYRPFGYETVVRLREYRADSAALPPPEDGGEPRLLRDDGEAGNLIPAYRRFTGGYSCAVVRDSERMARRLREHFAEALPALAWLRDGRVCGYALYHRAEGCAVADEWAAEDVRAFTGLLRACGGGGPVSWRSPWEPPFEMPGGIPAAEPPYTMLRIVDWAGLINGLPAGGSGGPVWIHIHDPGCPWNDGVWRLGVRDGALETRREARAPQAEASAGALALLASGAAPAGRVFKKAGDRALETLETLLPPLPTFLWEMY